MTHGGRVAEEDAVKPRILVIEDDANVVQGLLAGLRRAGYDVEVAMDGLVAQQRAVNESFDIVLLDLMLPEASGYEVLEAMSGRVSTPVLVLSARNELDARLKSFELGAVDFVSKPFWIEELIARIAVRLDRKEATEQRRVRLGGCEVDLDARVAHRDGADLGLTPIEFNVLVWLVEHHGHAVRRSTLALKALGLDEPNDRTVDSHVSRLRKKLGDDAALIKTVWGIGYRVENVG
ncbi:MAG: two-component system OmpR family response regulator [Myxococcota bacterium]|jgi:two-component system OmpR family response regulator